MNGYGVGSTREGTFHLNFRNLFDKAIHDILTNQKGVAITHEFSNDLPEADTL